MSKRVAVATTSGRKTSSALIASGMTLVSIIAIFTDGTNPATLTVYDNTEASGTIIWGPHTINGTDNAGGRPSGYAPVKCSNGVYAELSGIGASYIIEYIQTSVGVFTSSWETYN